ncbi:MAG TPA: DNA-binding response regulator [Cyanobacteria bacterium UBA8530]|nr:DNA-binding response regulator [Cyanobacteria bacterium UBA8530]
MRVLIVEDEPALARGLEELLASRDFQVEVEERGDRALARALVGNFDLLLLDVMLPGLSGFEVLKKLRSAKCSTPVILLTARGSEADKVLGFELAVDDYVTKPFSPLELLGRISAVLRRSRPAEGEPFAAESEPERLAFGEVEIDFKRYFARKNQTAIEAPAKCFEILRVLAKTPGEVVSRNHLIDEVWGEDEFINQRTLDNLVLKIRHVIEPDPADPRYLKTVHGVGYRLDLP